MPFFNVPDMRLFVIVTVLAIHSCATNNSDHQESVDLKEPLIVHNQQAHQKEDRLIEKYVERRKWNVNKSPTGLRYIIWSKGNGEKVNTGERVTVNYQVRLLDGTLCYSSNESGPRTFLVGRDQVETGLHEGVTYLNRGDSATFVVPSYLAHGFTGDLNKIPSRASLVISIGLYDE